MKNQPESLFVISGPVGSGKTTIGEINNPDIHIIIEDPVEYLLPGSSLSNISTPTY